MAAPGDSSVENPAVLTPLPSDTSSNTTSRDELNDLPRRDWLGLQQPSDLRTRPLMYWRELANRPVPFAPVFLFCLLTGTVAWLLLPGTLSGGHRCCKTSFWKSLLTGAVTLVLSAVFARFLFRSEMGFPLAVLILALLELGLVLGFAVSAALVGESVLGRLGVAGTRWSIESATAKRLADVAVGTVLICLLLLIPGIGGFPRIGTRLVMLLAFLGLGGLLRSSLERRKANTGKAPTAPPG